jgi:hypothetical protein
MALQPLAGKTATPALEKTFVQATGKVLPTPKKDRVKKGEDAETYAVNTMLYGPLASGKTFAAVDLLEMGYKILFVNTDIGGTGIISVKLGLKNRGLGHLAKNYRVINLNNYKEVAEFIQEPAVYFPEVYEFDCDFLFWDGFGYFQQTDLMAQAGEMIVESNDINRKADSKEVSELRETGFKFELADFQIVRNMTVRVVKGFCNIHNKKTGKYWHKIFTAQESMKSKKKEGAGNASELVDSLQPLLTGAGGVLTCGAFDLILRTVKEDNKKFTYIVDGGKQMSTKSRGFNLQASMEANFGQVWKTIMADLDLVNGAVDEKNIAPVLLAEETA